MVMSAAFYAELLELARKHKLELISLEVGREDDDGGPVPSPVFIKIDLQPTK